MLCRTTTYLQSTRQYHTYVWALVDANEATSGIPENLLARFTKYRAVRYSNILTSIGQCDQKQEQHTDCGRVDTHSDHG